MINIKFQTSELQPAPYAFAVQLDLTDKQGKLGYKFDLEYLDRDGLTDEEVFEEGFTLSDDIKLEGSLPKVWLEETKTLVSKTEKVEKTELEEEEDYWFLKTTGEPFYPKNPRQWATFLEQIRQAILENSGLEKPLEITLVENNITTKIVGSFENMNLRKEKENRKENLKWPDLNYLLKDLYSGDFDYEKATNKLKTGNGVYLNFGDDYWFELGKSYINKPQKIKKWL